MRNKVSKRGLGYTLLALLLMVMIALPLTMLIPNVGKFAEGNDGIDSVTSTTGTKITDEKELKAWLMGVQSTDGSEANGYLQKGAPITDQSLLHDAYLANDIVNFTNNANFQLNGERTLTGNGFTVTLIADPDLANVSIIANGEYDQMPVEANGSTNYRGQNTGITEVWVDQDETQGIGNTRFVYGVFLNHIELGSSIDDVKFIYTGDTIYNYNGWKRTINMGVIVGRNEGAVSNVSLDMQGFLKFQGVSPQPRNYVMIGGIAGYNGGTISNSDMTFSEGAGIQSYTPMKKDDKEGRSKGHAGGISGYNYGKIENVIINFNNVAKFECVGDRAIYASTAGEENGMNGRYPQAFTGSVAGRSSGAINGAIVNSEKKVGSINNLVESSAPASDVTYDGLFIGWQDSFNAAVSTDLFTDLNLDNIQGIHQSQVGYNIIHGVDLSFNEFDSDVIILDLPADAAENAIIWSVAGVNVYETPTKNYALDRLKVTDKKNACTVGTDLDIATPTLKDDVVLTYGDEHAFNWSDVFGTFDTYNDASLQVKEVYFKDGVDYVFNDKSRIDAGIYTFQVMYKTQDTKFAYLDNTNRILIESTEIQDVLIREQVTVNQKDVTLTWTGGDSKFTYTGLNQIDMIKASFTDLDGNNINADLKSIINGSGSTVDQGLKDAGEYKVYASFESSNYCTATEEFKVYSMAKATYDIKGLTLESYTGVYDGKAHGAQLKLSGSPLTDVDEILATFIGADRIKLIPTWSTDSKTDVCDEDVTFSLTSDNKNYEPFVFTPLPAKIIITSVEVDVQWEGQNYTYDGVDHFNSISATYVDVDGISRELNITNDQGNKFKDVVADGYTFTASLGTNDNYKIVSNEMKGYSITATGIDLGEIRWTDIISYDYTGEVIIPELVNLNGLEVTYTVTAITGEVTDGTAIDAGTYSITATLIKDDNLSYTGELTAVAKEFAINTIEYDFSRVVYTSKQYDYKNSAYTVVVDPTLIPVGKDNTRPVAEYTKNVFTNVEDSGEVSVSFTSISKNYTIPNGTKYTAYITIVAAEVDVTWEGSDFTYDGECHLDSIKASYMAHNAVEGGALVKTDAVVSIHLDIYFKEYKEGGYTFVANIANKNYTATIDADNNNTDGQSTAIFHINRVALGIDATKISSTSTKDSITISFADDVIGVGSITIGDVEFQTDLTITGLNAVTEYIVKVKLIPDASLAANFGDSEILEFTISTKYSGAQYDEKSITITEVTLDSRAELEQLLTIYNGLSEDEQLEKKTNFDEKVKTFNDIVDGINVAVEDNKKVAADTNVSIVKEEEASPVNEGEAAAMVATFGLIALAGVAFKKVGGAL